MPGILYKCIVYSCLSCLLLVGLCQVYCIAACPVCYLLAYARYTVAVCPVCYLLTYARYTLAVCPVCYLLAFARYTV